MLKRIILCLCVFLTLNSFVVYSEDISAKSYAVLDYTTASLLLEKDESVKMPMASTTKIMTCLIACESKKLDKTVTITPLMLDKTEGTLINLKVGNKITLYDLVKGAMLASGNDAANAIAVFLAKNIEAFSDIMNERAKELKMLNTHFVTPSGLDDKKHYSTAHDMALLAREVCNNETMMKIAALQSTTVKIDGEVYKINNHNKLLKSDSNFIGLKTGYTSKSGRCLISVYNYRGSKIICVTLNAPDDWNDHKTLVNRAKKLYNTTCSGDFVYIRTLSDKNKMLKCKYSYTASALDTVWVKVYYYPILYPPIRKGDKVGYVEIYSKKELLLKTDLISQENINGK